MKLRPCLILGRYLAKLVIAVISGSAYSLTYPHTRNSDASENIIISILMVAT